MGKGGKHADQRAAPDAFGSLLMQSPSPASTSAPSSPSKKRVRPPHLTHPPTHPPTFLSPGLAARTRRKIW